MAGADGDPLLRMSDVRKVYGHTRALDGADLSIGPAEIVGLVGHNGAGKSTLMRVIVGLTRPDDGTIEVGGRSVGADYGLAAARGLGIRIAFQELSLAPTLRVFENLLVAQPRLGGRGWQRRCRQVISERLDEIFPGHGISPNARVESLSLAQRQMVEITQATIGEDGALRLLILDEPTSALVKEHADNLFVFLRRLRDRGVSTILISHKMGEILSHTDRTIVMRDGRVVSAQPTAELDADSIVAAMGAATATVAVQRVRREDLADAPVCLRTDNLRAGRLAGVSVTVRTGEIVGLSGLDGQGQQQLLMELWRLRRSRGGAVRVDGSMAFVTGDRQTSGIFPLWSVARNIAVGVATEVSRWGFIDPGREGAVVKSWMDRLKVRGTDQTPITDLSGGNQQKALVARALASSARVILLDDPFRGVDIETRRGLYRLMREETGNGRSFLWFTTENAELDECDRVYVMSRGGVAAELASDEINEEAIVAASFAGT